MSELVGVLFHRLGLSLVQILHHSTIIEQHASWTVFLCQLFHRLTNTSVHAFALPAFSVDHRLELGEIFAHE